MAVKRQIRKRPAVPLLVQSVREYCQNRSLRERSAYHEEKLKHQLMDVIATAGVPDGDEGQHLKLDLDEPVDFISYKGEKGQPKTVVGIQRQQRAGRMVLNEERVMAFLASLKGSRKALAEQCLTTIQVVNEDALLAAVFEKQISDEEMQALYDESPPTFAFQLITE